MTLETHHRVSYLPETITSVQRGFLKFGEDSILNSPLYPTPVDYYTQRSAFSWGSGTPVLSHILERQCICLPDVQV